MIKFSDLGHIAGTIPKYDCRLGSFGTLKGDTIVNFNIYFEVPYMQYVINIPNIYFGVFPATFVHFKLAISIQFWSSQELSNLHPKIHAYIIEELMKKLVFSMLFMPQITPSVLSTPYS